MTKVLITQSKLDTLAEVIGGKSNTNVPLTVDEMITAADSITGGGGITPTGNINITQAGVTDVTNYATATVPQGEMYAYYTYGYKTVGGLRKWEIAPVAEIVSGDSYGTPGYIDDNTIEYGTAVTYNAIAKNTTVTPTTSAQTIGGANYMMEGAVTVSAMPSGTAGTPTATKGAVNNHAISVTPSVTNTTGYITGSTKTGTAVTVSASELVSGDKSITANGNNIDVANYSTVSVNVSGGGGESKNAQVVQGTTRTTSSSLTAIGAELTVSKTGTYNVYWSAFRSNTSSQYTFATKLYINGTGYGSEQTTWSNHQQNVHLSNVSLSANDKIRVYGRESRGSSYYMYAGTLTIIEA